MQLVIRISPETCSKRDVDVRLNEAIDTAMSMATRERSGGVLVTRHSPAYFTVSITAEVPYGWVREHDET
ncbi:hypothetical protein [Arthrobacter sp. ISL-65]|uniref:hypothetical protein n=1 Tax=Arthrobacter sp. ISL-65 TaxID=2819112 RepID=UPI001BE81481|nr:hypothetical protein [Arthrobacter sp. ISL-65]MBT2548997.1 hypothetical protein [Arthrobacter sp. ISL-65]